LPEERKWKTKDRQTYRQTKKRERETDEDTNYKWNESNGPTVVEKEIVTEMGNWWDKGMVINELLYFGSQLHVGIG
jgi:hypothetical protein